MTLKEGFKEKIEDFVSETEFLVQHSNEIGHNITLGWKFHIIKFHHSIDFLLRSQRPLGLYSEQTTKAVHKNINKTLKGFSVAQYNPEHKEKLRKMLHNPTKSVLENFPTFLFCFCPFLVKCNLVIY